MTNRKKIHRFITEYRKNGNTIEVVNMDIVHQIKDVIKLRHGEECIFTDSTGIEYLCEIEETAKNRIIANIISSEINENEPAKNVHLYLAILKKENFELVLEKASEMGIKEITPIITDRTIKTNLNFERLYKIAREASELSGRSQITKINEITNFEDAVTTDTNETKILFDITGAKKSNGDLLDKNSLSIYIGPEGGFTDKEIQLAKDSNISICNLGSLTLRGETAGIIACYLALN